MANDYLKKEPSKTEKMIYELAMNQHNMEKGLWSTSAHVVALGLALGADPKKIADFMVNGDEKIKEFSKTINDEIKRLEAEAHKGHNHAEGEGHEHAEQTVEKAE